MPDKIKESIFKIISAHKELIRSQSKFEELTGFQISKNESYILLFGKSASEYLLSHGGDMNIGNDEVYLKIDGYDVYCRNIND